MYVKLYQTENTIQMKRSALLTIVISITLSWTCFLGAANFTGPIDPDYRAPPGQGTLAKLDLALRVTPPPGLEVGCVPIVTRQKDASR